MVDHRVYRAAFLPALVALMLAAFSLASRPGFVTTRVAPDAFDAAAAARTLTRLAEAFPERLPGSAGDEAIAERLQRAFVSTGFATESSVRTETVRARTIEGRRDLTLVIAERPGLSSRRIVILAHRDARAGAPATTLSGTAVQLELARILADRDLRSTVVLASVSGGSGGYAGAARVVERIRGPIDTVLVLGDLAAERSRRPWVVPWASSGDPASHGLTRTVQSALRTETGQDPGRTRALAQWARRAVPLTVSEQGVVGAQGVPAVMVSATGELGPRAGDEVSERRLERFGRGVLRSFTAIEEARPERDTADPEPAFGGPRGILVMGRLLPDWAVRIAVLALLLPALLGAVDAFFRVRRRGASGRRWLLWVGTLALPFLLAWAWLRLLGVVGVGALPAPSPPAGLGLGAGPALALASVALVLLGGFAGLRRLILRAARPSAPARERRPAEAPADEVAVGGPAAAVGLTIGLLALLVWVRNPYAAAVLLPAAHLWLLVPAPESRIRGVAAVVAVLAGLLAPLGIAAYFVVTFDLGATGGLRVVFDALAGGEAGLFDAAALALLLGAAIGALLALRLRRLAAPRQVSGPGAPRRTPSTRGPRTYAGPGSLGGTESALRR